MWHLTFSKSFKFCSSEQIASSFISITWKDVVLQIYVFWPCKATYAFLVIYNIQIVVRNWIAPDALPDFHSSYILGKPLPPHTVPSRNCTSQNTESYGVQGIFHCLQMCYITYNHRFVNYYQPIDTEFLNENYQVWQFTIYTKWRINTCT